MPRHLTYFVSDVHLGLQVQDPARRETRFVEFLRGIPAEETEALYLLGDIWDFWYEYKDVVPKGYVRVFSALLDLMDAGVKVYFFTGNHDIWAYSYFRELGMTVLEQPHVTTIGGKRFCLGHGDGLGPGDNGYKLMRWAFHNRFLQKCFSTLHPRIAFSIGNGWSRKSRLAKNVSYFFRGKDEPLWKWCSRLKGGADFFIFGHYHTRVDMPVEPSGRLLLLGDWITKPNWLVFDGQNGKVFADK
ncbi:MAG: UDP-2,3-diacylglucosamine diphosphatase [Bacteroidales bacterium]|nr:UDP-2,3-diacylglucosamine diphosphatase [Bacteroidales bacterium]